MNATEYVGRYLFAFSGRGIGTMHLIPMKPWTRALCNIDTLDPMESPFTDVVICRKCRQIARSDA